MDLFSFRLQSTQFNMLHISSVYIFHSKSDMITDDSSVHLSDVMYHLIRHSNFVINFPNEIKLSQNWYSRFQYLIDQCYQ